MDLKADGMNYAPQGRPRPVVKPGEFVFAAVRFDHGHIYGQCNGLVEAGAELRYAWDPDPERLRKFCATYPGTEPLRSLDEVLEKREVRLVAAAAIPNERGELGCRVMRAGKDYFTDKTPFTSLEQLRQAERTAAETGRKYAVYYSERLHVESAVHAGQLIRDGVVGRVVQVIGLGPHRHGPAGSRPDWFYRKEQYGGILCDIGSHQCEQFLAYTGSTDGVVTDARVANYAHPQHPEFEDFGEAKIEGSSGASFFYRVDWFTPDGLRTWGDGRTIILGTDGYIELRKYIDVARSAEGDNLYLVTKRGEEHMRLAGQVGFPFFGELILDCLERTERAMTQAHAFKAAELCLRCQEMADRRQAEARER
jgi:predicted dehydrogenase